MDIDEILKRADVRDASQDYTAGEDLLNAFKVANFNIASSQSDNFWEKVIPENMRKVEDPSPVILPPRRRTKIEEEVKETKGITGRSVLHLVFTISAGRGKPKGTKNKKKTKKRGGASSMDKKDFRAFLRSWKKFGDLSRIAEIMEDAGLSNKDSQEAADVAEGVSD